MNNYLIFIALIFFILVSLLAGKVKKNRRFFYKAQLKRVKATIYFKKKLLNETEAISYKTLRKILVDENYLFSQVSLGEILKNSNYRLYKDIMSKRVDFLITDREFNPIVVIEINGSGHYLSSSSYYRDEIKRIAIESSSICYISVHGNINNIENNIISTCLPEFTKLNINKTAVF